MKKFFSRLVILLTILISYSTTSYSALGSNVLELRKLALYQDMLKKYEELAQKDKKEEKKSSFIEKTIKQTASITKKWAGPLLPYATLAVFGSLTANNIAYSILPSWLVTVRPYSLGDIILSPQGLALMFLLAQD